MKGIIVLLSLLVPVFLSGQVIRSYESLSQLDSLERMYPEVVTAMATLESELPSVEWSETDAEIILPLVFHIVYRTETDKVGIGEVDYLIDQLNEAYYSNELPYDHPSRKNGYDSRFVDMGLQFCKGANVSAIQFHKNDSTSWSVNNDVKRAYPSLNPEQYINVWVVDLPSAVRGYAQFPSGKSEYDGIVLNAKELKQHSATVKSTITHLMGNYLGLYPLWGRCYCCDDYVDDTPVANAPNYGCSQDNHVTLCNTNYPREMTYNAMDAGYAMCGIFFTEGQRERVRSVLTHARSGLLTSEVECIEISTRNSLDLGELVIHPNPASNRVRISSSNDERLYEIRIYDLLGTEVYKHNDRDATSLEIDIRQWHDGAYLIKRKLGGDQVQSYKLILIK